MFLKKFPLIKIFFFLFVLNLLLSLAYNSFSKGNKDITLAKADSKHGEKLFKKNCSGCHANGINLIKPNKPIIGSLKLKSKAGFKEFIESPPPPMPKFKNITSKSSELDNLYSYVISLMGK